MENRLVPKNAPDYCALPPDSVVAYSSDGFNIAVRDGIDIDLDRLTGGYDAPPRPKTWKEEHDDWYWNVVHGDLEVDPTDYAVERVQSEALDKVEAQMHPDDTLAGDHDKDEYADSYQEPGFPYTLSPEDYMRWLNGTYVRGSEDFLDGDSREMETEDRLDRLDEEEAVRRSQEDDDFNSIATQQDELRRMEIEDKLDREQGSLDRGSMYDLVREENDAEAAQEELRAKDSETLQREYRETAWFWER